MIFFQGGGGKKIWRASFKKFTPPPRYRILIYAPVSRFVMFRGTKGRLHDFVTFFNITKGELSSKWGLSSLLNSWISLLQGGEWLSPHPLDVSFPKLVYQNIFLQKGFIEGRKASHNSFSSEPHSPHFLVRATSESSFFDFYVSESFQFSKIKLFFQIWPRQGVKYGCTKVLQMITSCQNLQTHENDVKLYLGKASQEFMRYQSTYIPKKSAFLIFYHFPVSIGISI